MKKEEIVRNFTAMVENKYQTNTYFDELEKLENQICNTIMPQVLDKKGWYDEIIKQLEKYHFNDEVMENEVKPRFISVAKKMTNEIKKKRIGNTGERYVTKFVDEAGTYFENPYLISNVCLKYNDIKVEIDNILITDKAIFIIETKNWSKKIYISSSGEIFEDNKIVIGQNIINSMANKRLALWHILKEKGLKNIHINEFVVNANQKNKIKSETNKIMIFNNAPDIVEYIRNYNSGICYSQRDIDSVKEVIENSIYFEEYPVEYNIEQFKNDAAEIFMAFNIENNNDESVINDETNNDIKAYIMELFKNNFSWKKCALYIVLIGASIAAGTTIKVFK